jgi:hypothetical protein
LPKQLERDSQIEIAAGGESSMSYQTDCLVAEAASAARRRAMNRYTFTVEKAYADWQCKAISADNSSLFVNAHCLAAQMTSSRLFLADVSMASNAYSAALDAARSEQTASVNQILQWEKCYREASDRSRCGFVIEQLNRIAC